MALILSYTLDFLMISQWTIAVDGVSSSIFSIGFLITDFVSGSLGSSCRGEERSSSRFRAWREVLGMDCRAD